MKGLSSLVEYTFVILLSVLVVTALTAVVYTFYGNAQKDVVTGELRQVAVQTSESVQKIYYIGKSSQTAPSINSSVMLANLTIPLPRQLASRNYKITLVSTGPLWAPVSSIKVNSKAVPFTGLTHGMAVVETTQNPLLSASQDIPNVDVYLQGSSQLSNSTLTYYRYNINGNITDLILLGTGNIFGQITGIS